MKRREVPQSPSNHEASHTTEFIGPNGYIDITPYQQKGDPCYGGDTGETEYENYMQGIDSESERSSKAQVHTNSGKRR